MSKTRRSTISLLLILCLTITIIPFTKVDVSAATVQLRHIWPVKDTYEIDHNGGQWNDWDFHYEHGHYGVDIPAPEGTNVYASAAGTVVESNNNGAYGKHVLIKHKDGVYTLYAHMSVRSVKKGDTVKQAQKVGEVGDTGHSYGNHLHYGMYVAKKYFDNEIAYKPVDGTLNPEDYLEKWMTLKASNNASTGKPIVTWTKYPGATKYVVYSRTVSGEWEKKLTTTGTTFKNTSAKPTWGYYYKVKAYNGTKLLKTSKEVYRNCKIAKPEFYSISKDSKNRVVLKFRGSKSANCYKIYRSTSATGTYKLLYSLNVKTDTKDGVEHLFYTSSGTKGTKYYYKIQAVHTKWPGADSAKTGYRYIVR